MKQKSWLRRHPRCAVLATGALALLISALPLAALRVADVPLFTRPHERSWRSVQSVQVSGEDLYLVQALRERDQQDFYWQSEEMELNDDGFSMISNYIGDLVDVGVLNADWMDFQALPTEIEAYLVESRHYLTCSYMRDSAGFLTLSVWENDMNGRKYALWAQVTLESTTGKVTNFCLAIPEVEFDPMQLLKHYIDYLGLSGLDDWEVTAGGEMQSDENTVMMYSPKANVYVSMYSIVGIVPEGLQIAGGLYPG